MGAWLDVNGESIYGTQPGPIQGEAAYRTTQTGDTVYLHVFDWPADGRIALPDLDMSSATWLDANCDAALSLTREGGQLVIQGPAEAPNEHVTVIKLEG